MVLPNRSGRSVVAGPTIRSAAAPDRTTVTREVRSEEHTSELQSRQYLVCRLLLEKKKENVKRTRDLKDEESIKSGVRGTYYLYASLTRSLTCLHSLATGRTVRQPELARVWNASAS